jgi:SAM-dependent methyltransferase
VEVIDLGLQPWGNNFLDKTNSGSEPYYPLTLILCDICSASQLNFTVPKEVMFSNHTYLSGTTKSLSAHFEETAIEITKLYFENDTRNLMMLDIGSNDGTQLSYYKKLGFNVLGIESASNLCEIANSRGIQTLNEFFNENVAKNMDTKFDLINASGVFFHLEELHSVCEGIRLALKSDGIFQVQFIYMKRMQDNLAFDQIYHEHLLYYTLKSLNYLLDQFDLELFDAYESPIHGGSMIGFISHKDSRILTSRLKRLIEIELKEEANDLITYETFARNVLKSKTKTLDWVNKNLASGKSIMGLGAPVKGNTLLNYFDLNTSHISALLERNELRRGLFAPGSRIPILLEDELIDYPDAFLVLAWNFKNEILLRYKQQIDAGIEFYFPVDVK